MTDKTLSQVVGGGGAWKVTFDSGLITIPSSQSGTYITLTPPTGERVRLLGLASTNADQTNLTSIDVGGVTVLSGKTLQRTANASPTILNGSYQLGFEWNQAGFFTGEPDEIIEISTNVNTTQPGMYFYQFGVI